MKRLFLLILATMIFAVPAEAAFDALKKNNAPRILLAEVTGYGVYELKPEFMENFYDVIRENLQTSFNVTTRNNLNDFDFEPTEEDEIFSTIHMDAIAHGRLYLRRMANVKMIRYGDSIFGKEYFQDEKKTAARRKLEGKPYNLTPAVAENVRALGEKYDVDYMLFCNVRDADVWRKTGGIFGASPSTDDLRGKRAKIEMEYYLVNVKTGKVFEGQNIEKRTSLTTNVLIGKYGNNYTIGDMINFVLNKQAGELVENLTKKGLKAIKF